MQINTNIAALVGMHNYAKAQAAVERTLERLATGKRINRAADDPSGLLAAEQLGNRRSALEQVLKTSERAGYMLDAADGALGELETMLHDLTGVELAAANRGAMSDAEREALQIEANSIVNGMRHIIATTTFNGQQLLADGAQVSVHGATLWINGLDVRTLGHVKMTETGENGEETSRWVGLEELMGSGVLNIMSGDPEVAAQVVENARAAITGMRATIGAFSKYTLGSQTAALHVERENTAAAESLILDADIAVEVSSYVRGEVLRQASAQAIGLAHKQALQVLNLLG
jgi:flagellin